ncbi:damage-inducible protein DinB [Rhodosalinus halophilus]|uniref:Damage-inducible protein DinB n=1 Tax=Rhodosalinus halophilus TaxID=2259333 RepID=A0A365UAN2_9RHOB|nr:DinB family protein [Rhodosalinus halophilus]RBI85801.1 damage-inducible protein DinB [Rhodosalinus halophilus]
MIGPDYCRMLARYGAWQNAWLRDRLEAMPAEAATRDRGAFFGSLLGTANHVLWADRVWLARLEGAEGPGGTIRESAQLCPSAADWGAARAEMDARLIVWADGLEPTEVEGDLTWWSGAAGREVRRPRALCIVHMFNHATQHRGQMHAMLTASGVDTEDTDLFLMPEDWHRH